MNYVGIGFQIMFGAFLLCILLGVIIILTLIIIRKLSDWEYRRSERKHEHY